MRLWIEHAHQSLSRAGEGGNDAVGTFQTEEQFFAVQVSCPEAGAEGGAKARRIVEQAASLLQQGRALDTVAEAILAALPEGEYVPMSILQVLGGCRAHLVECDAPPLFMVRQGRLVLLPVLEEEVRGRLVRRCRFPLQDGDHLAIASPGYIRIKGWGRRWGWQDIALSIKRLTDTGCDAQQLLGALIRTYQRLAGGVPEREVTVVAMHVRPVRTVTLWSGPPLDPAQDQAALDRLMAGPGKRIICGDTTAEIAARLLGRELEMEARPADGWAEVPPTSRLEGVDLVTEGVVTMGVARERTAGAQRVRDLPRRQDGATRLARVLLEADVIHFLVGLAVNPAQTADDAGTVPLRRIAIEGLMNDLRARGKVVSVEHVG